MKKSKTNKESKSTETTRDKGVNSTDLLESKSPKEEAEQLIDELSKLCGLNGWDFYSAVFMDQNHRFERLTESGNNFIRQHTMISCNSPGLQTILGLPWAETSDIA